MKLKTNNKLEIKEYSKDGHYLIYSDGRIYSKKTDKFLTPRINRFGYYMVTMRINGKLHTPTVHRIVAETFLENDDNLPQVNHIDENKLNNDVSNLEFCTAKYNSNYGTRLKRVSNTRRAKHCKGKPVRQLDLYNNIVHLYPSTKEAGRALGIDPSNIAKVCNHIPHYNHIGGYKWEWVKI